MLDSDSTSHGICEGSFERMAIMLDVYDWILSQEIRDYQRENYPLSCMEKAEIICSAYRPIEDKYAALCALLDEAEKEAEQEVLEQLLRLYRWVFEELGRDRFGQIFVCETQFVSEDDIGQMDDTNGSIEGIFCAYEEVLDFFRGMEKDHNFSPGYSFYVEKWAPANNGMEEILGLEFYFIDGAFHVTMFWPHEGKCHDTYQKLNIEYDAQRLHEYYLEVNELPLPFQSGDLVRLDPPALDDPLYGVLYIFDPPQGSRYMWLFYLRDGVLNYCPMRYHGIGSWSPWRVLDWTHTADFSELPSGQEILKEISQIFHHLAGQGTGEAELYKAEDFFGELADHLPTPIYRRTPITLKELLNRDGS